MEILPVESTLTGSHLIQRHYYNFAKPSLEIDLYNIYISIVKISDRTALGQNEQVCLCFGYYKYKSSLVKLSMND